MALALDPSSNGAVNFGDPTFPDGVGGLSVAITLHLTASPSTDLELISKWGIAFSTQCFLLRCINTDELGFLVGNDTNSAYYGRQTSGLDMVNGGTYRIVATVAFGSPPTMALWVNGSSQGFTTQWVASNNVTAATIASSSIIVGHESGVDGLTADYSEAAIWTEVIPDWMCAAYGQGVCPHAYRQNGGLYAPLFNTAHSVDVWGGLTGSQTGASSADHPAMFYPGTSFVGSLAAAGGGGGGGTIPVFMHHYRQQGAA